MRVPMIRLLLIAIVWVFSLPAISSQPVDIYRAQALVKTQSEAERNAAARAAFGELMVRVSGQRDALNNPVVRSAMPNAKNYLFGFSYKSSTERLVEDGRSFTALALQLDYEPQAIAQLLRDAQLPLWPAQRPSLLVWLVSKDASGLRLVPHIHDMQTMNSFAAYRGLPLVVPSPEALSLTAEDVWQMNLEKIKLASTRYNADAILIGRYMPSAMGSIPPVPDQTSLAVVSDSSFSSASSVSSIEFAVLSSATSYSASSEPAAPIEGPWVGDWLLLQGESTQALADETPEIKGLFNNAIDWVADYFASQYAIAPTTSGPKTVLVRVANISSFASFKQAQKYFEGLAMVQRVEVATVNSEGILLRLTTDADVRLLKNTLSLERRLAPVQTAPLAADVNTADAANPLAAGSSSSSLGSSESVQSEAIDADALAELERAIANEQGMQTEAPVSEVPLSDATEPSNAARATGNLAGITNGSGSEQDPLIYVWQPQQ